LLSVIESLSTAMLPITVLTADKLHFKVCEEKGRCERHLHFCEEPARAPADIHSNTVGKTITTIIMTITMVITIILPMMS